jgi:MFS superfamily sulfate permease-like transporter
LGGYVAGKIARQNEIVYGFATGIGVLLVSVTLTFLMGLSTKPQSPIWQLALSLVVNIGSTTLGGYLAFIQRKRKQANLMMNNIETPQAS